MFLDTCMKLIYIKSQKGCITLYDVGIHYLIVQHPLSYIVRMSSSKENG